MYRRLLRASGNIFFFKEKRLINIYSIQLVKHSGQDKQHF